ncbi:hypothetical protein KOW79_018443 [Hemibagrus wyckioides]|uniref:Uncharacterized protein n=1 Tax=Hemibagrus wyckioides TaxID=337641 RepID=A0A9D3NCB2_9TELE|nr:hypothetical protein KOW79_018443 [Hemibagrus wyckioides]
MTVNINLPHVPGALDRDVQMSADRLLDLVYTVHRELTRAMRGVSGADEEMGVQCAEEEELPQCQDNTKYGRPVIPTTCQSNGRDLTD